jgi:dTDP-4-amino-4,6-dideoxy-D-galactose acyltransferase
MAAPCQLLPWDTEFFGVRIARVNGSRLNLMLISEINTWCSVEAISCLYFLADSNDAVTVRLAEDHDYRLVDIRLTFERKLIPDEVLPLSGQIRPFRPVDLPVLIDIARTSYRDTRFYFDPCFPSDKCDLLYETWVHNSTQGFADIVLVAELNGLTAGFISCKCQGIMGSIGLVGVAESARGRSLGQALVNGALEWFTEQGMLAVQVVTQGRNLSAQRLYQRCGFLTTDLGLWYHKWFKECGAS